jgi:hypothetical protein
MLCDVTLWWCCGAGSISNGGFEVAGDGFLCCQQCGHF